MKHTEMFPLGSKIYYKGVVNCPVMEVVAHSPVYDEYMLAFYPGPRYHQGNDYDDESEVGEFILNHFTDVTSWFEAERASDHPAIVPVPETMGGNYLWVKVPYAELAVLDKTGISVRLVKMYPV